MAVPFDLQGQVDQQENVPKVRDNTEKRCEQIFGRPSNYLFFGVIVSENSMSAVYFSIRLRKY
jgi:hypothetical protein